MSSDKDRGRDFQEEELAFFGAVTASISHDLNNAIAIIEQTAGLLEDLTMANDGGQPVPNEQLQNIAQRIANQTKRGATIVRRLNAFAHSVDEDDKELELNALVKTVIALAHRVAERKRVTVETCLPAQPVTIRNNAFRVQQAVFLSIQRAVDATQEEETIVLSTGTGDTSAWISVDAKIPDDSPPANGTDLESLMNQIGGKVESNIDGSTLSSRLVFPT